MHVKTLVVALLLAMAGSANAGPDEHGPRMERLTKRLELEEKQVEPVRTIFDRSREQHRTVMEKHMKAAKPELDEIEAKTRKELGGVLNAEQLSRYDEFVEKRRARHEQRMKDGPPRKRHGQPDSQ